MLMWPWDANTSGTTAESKEPPPSQESSVSPINIIHACVSISVTNFLQQKGKTKAKNKK